MKNPKPKEESELDLPQEVVEDGKRLRERMERLIKTEFTIYGLRHTLTLAKPDEMVRIKFSNGTEIQIYEPKSNLFGTTSDHINIETIDQLKDFLGVEFIYKQRISIYPPKP